MKKVQIIGVAGVGRTVLTKAIETILNENRNIECVEIQETQFPLSEPIRITRTLLKDPPILEPYLLENTPSPIYIPKRKKYKR